MVGRREQGRVAEQPADKGQVLELRPLSVEHFRLALIRLVYAADCPIDPAYTTLVDHLEEGVFGARRRRLFVVPGLAK
jgi:hypothetical protein